MLTQLTLGLLLTGALLAPVNDEVERLEEARMVFEEIMAAPDKGIPRDLLSKAHCIVIVPSVVSNAAQCQSRK